MTDINRVIVIGRLTRDCETKFTQSGQAVCKFSIAVNRKRKVGDQWEDEANFFDAVLWGRQAESLNQYLVKGKQVAIDGELRQDRWEQDGQKRSRIEIVVGSIELLGGGQGAGGGGSYQRGEGAHGSWGGGGSNSGGSSFGARSQSSGGGGGGGGAYDGSETSHSGGGASSDHFSDDIPF
jgi:single-strand DNA-binding protein